MSPNAFRLPGGCPPTKVRVYVDYTDGRYSFKKLAMDDKVPYSFVISLTEYRLWQAAETMDQFVQDRMAEYDAAEARCVAEEGD